MHEGDNVDTLCSLTSSVVKFIINLPQTLLKYYSLSVKIKGNLALQLLKRKVKDVWGQPT